MRKELFPLVQLTFFILFAVSVSYMAYAEEMTHSDGEVILNMLLKKGVINQEEYNGMKKNIYGVAEEEKKWKKHVDKHITHMKDVEPRFLQNISIAGGITMVGQGTIGNDKNALPEEDVIDGSISGDLELEAYFANYGTAFLLIEPGIGNGLQDDEIVSFWGVNDDAGDNESKLEVTEAWYEKTFLDYRLTFTIGKVDLTNYFDGSEVANDETTQFLATGFVNSIAIEFPDNTIGARLTLSPMEHLDISIGWQDGDGDFEDIFDGSFVIGEVDIKPKLGDLQGNYRVYGWINGQDHEDFGDPINVDEDNLGVGVSLDQQVTNYLTLFTRIGYQDKDVNEFDIAWSGGLGLSGSLWGRDNDVLGIAYGQAILSDDFENNLRANGISPNDEGHLEIYYSIVINDNLAISPDIQVVTNAQGNGDFETVWIGGLRGQLTF